jgi:hypothetical protein
MTVCTLFLWSKACSKKLKFGIGPSYFGTECAGPWVKELDANHAFFVLVVCTDVQYQHLFLFRGSLFTHLLIVLSVYLFFCITFMVHLFIKHHCVVMLGLLTFPQDELFCVITEIKT